MMTRKIQKQKGKVRSDIIYHLMDQMMLVL
jgi:hypothetical protein